MKNGDRKVQKNSEKGPTHPLVKYTDSLYISSLYIISDVYEKIFFVFEYIQKY